GIFGFELEPNDQTPEGWSISVDFKDGATTVGTITDSVGGTSGALLFAASTPDQPFTSVVITAAPGANGFAIANPRYSLADLSITKSVDKLQVNPDGSLTYTLDVTNNGPCVAASAVVSDPLPADTRFVSAL